MFWCDMGVTTGGDSQFSTPDCRVCLAQCDLICGTSKALFVQTVLITVILMIDKKAVQDGSY